MCDEMYKTSLICVDGYENSVLTGRIFNLYLGTDIPFRSTMEFIKETEALMQELQYPQSFFDSRGVIPGQEQITRESAGGASSSKKGQLATFSLKVMFRQNSSWQGSLSWVEKKQEQRFRSVLELLMMIDSAVAA